MFFETGIRNFVCGCIYVLGERRISFFGHCDIVIFLSREYLLYYLSLESQIWRVDDTLDGGVLCTILGSL